MDDIFPDDSVSFIETKAFIIVLLALLNIPICLKREIKELKPVAYTLTISVVTFVCSLFFLLNKEGLVNNPM